MALEQSTRPVARRVPVGVPVATGAASVAVGALALVTAPGVTRLDEYTYDTTFVTAWWWLAHVLVVPAAVLLWRTRTRAGYAGYVVTGAALVVPHLAVAALVVARYRATGWGDGLEVFAFVHPVGLLVLTAVVLGGTGAVDAARRRRAAVPAV